MLAHGMFGLCVWDIPALIVLAAIIVIFAVHRHKLKKREEDFEKELADKWENVPTEDNRRV